ncbi:MAG: hypothetical protein WD851_14645 [Pirellulales bacterium]
MSRRKSTRFGGRLSAVGYRPERVRAFFWVASLLAVLAGCTRSHYRTQADRDAYCLTDQKLTAAGDVPGEFRIDIDPRSRMYSPYDPDFPPMPPDDPTSHRYMEVVDGMRNAPQWRKAPRTPNIENPDWKPYVPHDDQGKVVLDLPAAVQLALLQSPEYQDQLEELYLSALDVSFERFRFDAQFFGGSSIFYTVQGPVRSGRPSGSSILDVSPSRFANPYRVERLNAFGGEFVAGIANSLMWQFAGPDDYRGQTLIDFTFIQPLLRFGGRARVLERLTLSERALLANVRTMERYRGGFYLSIATGRDAGEGPSRRGGFFGEAGLEGFSGVGGGGFGRVGGFGGFGGGGQGGFTGGAGAAAAGGYIGLLQTQQELRNQYANVAALRESVEQLQASTDAGRIDRFQVDLARQALYNAQSQLLGSEAAFEATLDNFKIEMGMPPDMPTVIRDPLLDRFNLLNPDLTDLQTRTSNSLERLREFLAADEERAAPQPELAAELDWPVLNGELREIIAQSGVQLETLRQDFVALQAALPARRAHLLRLAGREEVRLAQIDPQLFSPAGLDARVEAVRQNMVLLENRFDQTLARLEQSVAAAESRPGANTLELSQQVTDLSNLLLELTIEQARARIDAITFEPVELSAVQALAIASRYRLDWMNARSQLVDTWRLITFNANALKGDLNIVVEGDIGNVGDNPFNLSGENGSLRMGVQWDPPLTRLAERNVYRQSLIEYSQARRSYYQYVDRVYQGLRNTLRTIELNEVNFELRRAAVMVAISQVDITQLRLAEPPKPGIETQFGVTTARDLVQSLSDLLLVQNDFLSVWVNYEVQRMNLEFDLGLMEIDGRGLRVEQEIPYAAILECLGTPPTPIDSDVNEDAGNLPSGEELPPGVPTEGHPPGLELMPDIDPGLNEPLPPPGDPGGAQRARRDPGGVRGRADCPAAFATPPDGLNGGAGKWATTYNDHSWRRRLL